MQTMRRGAPPTHGSPLALAQALSPVGTRSPRNAPSPVVVPGVSPAGRPAEAVRRTASGP